MTLQSGPVTFSRHAAVPSTAGGGTTSPQANEDLTPWSPGSGDPWDMKKVRHLGRRAAFGLRPEEAETLLQVGHKIAIDVLLVVPHLPIPDRGTYLLPSGEVINLSTYSHQVAAWLYLMHTSPWQLQEKMALFWHDHFSTGIGKVVYAEIMGKSINLYRRLALGSFRDLLIGATIDPGMLYFLDNRLSTRTRPNENYAREIFELYSMGVGGGYSEQDIQETARAFTGITAILDYQYFNSGTHDNGSKTVLGQVLNNGSGTAGIVRDLLGVVDAILKQPATAKYIVRKIWEYFVYENPSQNLVDQLATFWRQDSYDIRALMERIFRSRAFYSPDAMRSLVKSPAEYVIGALRNTATPDVWYTRLATRFLTMGLPLLAYPGPDGVPEGMAWINSQTIINRANCAMEMIERRAAPDSSYLHSHLDPEREILRKSIDTSKPDPIVDYFLDLLVDGDVPATVRNDLVAYMTRTNTGTRQWDYANNKARELREKVAGLIHLIHALPEAHIN